MNQFCVHGRVTKVSSRETKAGLLLTFKLKERCWNKQRGNFTKWWSCSAFGHTAKSGERFMKDGSHVVVYGEIIEKMFKREGEDEERPFIAVNVTRLDVTRESGSGGGGSSAEPDYSNSKPDYDDGPADDDDIPF